jgi:hypothetical protein
MLIVSRSNNNIVISGGRQGLPGVGGGSPSHSEVEFQAALDGSQSVLLTLTASDIDVFINGLKQSRTSYIFSAPNLSLPGTLNIMAGDIITIIYQG